MARVSAERRAEWRRLNDAHAFTPSVDEIADLLADLADAEARAERAEAALAEIATLEHCDECPDHDEIPYDPTEHRLAHPVTHETMFFKLQVLLCARCAPLRDARYRKAESKGSGKQPDVVPHEAPEHVRIAREALTAAGRGKGGG